jgi:putative N6-adenine-specific DNA methylase
MCGGGTLLIEAAMQALNIPAGFYRREYGFYQWKNFDRNLWKRVREEADIQDDVTINFYGSDIDGRFLDIARANVQKARLQDFIILERQDMRRSNPENTPSVVMMNPPYGERLSVEDINSFYKEIGDTFKNRYAGCKAYIITSDKDALKHIGLKPSRKWPLLNGSLECMFQEYELFSGDRKQHVIRQKNA